MNYFNFKRRKLTSGPHIIGMLLIVAGSINLVSPVLLNNETAIEKVLAIGLGALILGLIIVLSYSGTLINFATMKAMKYTSVVGFRFGEWEELPSIENINVITKRYRSTNTSNGISPTLSAKVTDFRVYLHSNNVRPELSFIYSNKEEAVNQAQHLASNLNAKLVIEA